MPTTFRYSFFAGTIVALVLGLWLAQLWQADNQVRLHSAHFLERLEKRNAAAASDFIAMDYHDNWGHDRSLVLNRLRMVLRLFSSLTITAITPQVTFQPSAATWSASIQLAGAGGQFAPEIVGQVNSLTKPFELHWRHESWRPWDWKLVEVNNPDLEFSGGVN